MDADRKGEPQPPAPSPEADDALWDTLVERRHPPEGARSRVAPPRAAPAQRSPTRTEPTLERTLEDLRADVSAMGEFLTRLRADVSGMGESLTALRADVSAMGESLTALRADLRTLKGWIASGQVRVAVDEKQVTQIAKAILTRFVKITSDGQPIQLKLHLRPRRRPPAGPGDPAS